MPFNGSTFPKRGATRLQEAGDNLGLASMGPRLPHVVQDEYCAAQGWKYNLQWVHVLTTWCNVVRTACMSIGKNLQWVHVPLTWCNGTIFCPKN